MSPDFLLEVWQEFEFDFQADSLVRVHVYYALIPRKLPPKGKWCDGKVMITQKTIGFSSSEVIPKSTPEWTSIEFRGVPLSSMDFT